jgi:hypothetical protein
LLVLNSNINLLSYIFLQEMPCLVGHLIGQISKFVKRVYCTCDVGTGDSFARIESPEKIRNYRNETRIL